MISTTESSASSMDYTSMLSVLTDAHKKTPVAPRIAALESLLGGMEQDNFVNYEAYFLAQILPVLFDRMNDKPVVKEAADKAGTLFMDKFNIQAFPALFPAFFAHMNESAKWKSKLAAVNWLSRAIIRVNDEDRDLLSACLPELVPVLSQLLYDTKPAVATAAEQAIRLTMKGITNRDLEPFIDNLVEAMKDRGQTESVIRKLGGVVFVQTVEGSALSVVVPLMIAGFRQPKAIIKRMCARITGNMSKLVEQPLEAAPFLGELIPAIFDAIDTIADPEARSVVQETHQQLKEIDAEAKKAALGKEARNPHIIAERLAEKIGMPRADVRVAYISEITGSLIRTRTTEEREWKDNVSPYLESMEVPATTYKWLMEQAIQVMDISAAEEAVDEGVEVCNCEFTLAYGTKILLHNTRLRLLKGAKYGLVGRNDCGKTTLMRAISEASIDGFPEDLPCVFVEADIQGELSHLNCVDYILEWPAIKAMGATGEQVRSVLLSVGFTEGKSAGEGGDCDDPISSLSGGWRMKLALARAMLQKADILLMDEPTNHLDAANVKWVKGYINSLKDVTCIMVSHDPTLLDECCTHIMDIDKLKLSTHKGNLTEYVKTHPDAKHFFEFKAAKFAFKFPQPSFLEGVKSKGKALLKMDNVSFTYPGNTCPTVSNITIRASMGSRVAVVGQNGAGKSTMIKVLTGELEPQLGSVWKYPNSRIGYIAQHAFSHIEHHLDKTPNEYIRWRFEFGDDREGLDKANMKLSEKDQAALAVPIEYVWTIQGKGGKVEKKEKRVISELTGQRRENPQKKTEFQYEVKWLGLSMDNNAWVTEKTLSLYHKIYTKYIRIIDAKILAKESMFQRPLTQENVEEHLAAVGLEPEYGTHFQISSLSGGQKVKVVLAAAMWDQPHILILDEPTNYLDRESLGALASAIEVYEGGVIMITHNDSFCRQLCPERWVLEKGKLNTEGDIEWMTKLADQTVEFQTVEEMVDGNGNEVVLRKKKLNAKEKKKMKKTIMDKIKNDEELNDEETEYAIEYNL